MRISITLLVLCLFTGWSFAQFDTDDVHLRFQLRSEGYFYNAEFSHPVKPGYTLPGISVKPSATLELGSKLEFTAGYFTSYMQGKAKDGLYLSRPLFTIAAHLFGDSGLYCALGTLPVVHPLPEFVYSMQYAWLHNLEAGAQICYDTRWFRLQTWIDWDRFIWKDANDEERFLFGAQLHALPNPDNRITYNAFFLARHHGGQIDTSHLPVVTSSNLGLELGYSYFLGVAHSLGARIAAVASHDGHKPTPLSQRNGWAIRPEIWWTVMQKEKYHVRIAASYFYGRNFISMRGEELYRSYSMWSDGYVQSQRQIAHGSFLFEERLWEYASFQFGANGYYDLDLRRIDYDFYLRLKLDLGWGW